MQNMQKLYCFEPHFMTLITFCNLNVLIQLFEDLKRTQDSRRYLEQILINSYYKALVYPFARMPFHI